MEWEVILSAAFVAIGVIEYLKGFFKTADSKVWRLMQPALCLLIAGVAAYLPSWVITGLLALALSQVGYEVIIETVKKKIGGK